MKQQQTYAAGDPIAAADLNTWQDKTVGGRAASISNDFGATTVYGADRVLTQLATTVANGTVKQIDASIDWRDRVVKGCCTRLAASDERIGQGLDYETNDPTYTTVAKTLFVDTYTGTGAYSNVAGAGTAVSNGNPPVNSVGGVRSYAPIVDDRGTGSVYLYVSPSDYSLNVYNNSGGALYLRLEIEASGKTALR